jgi:hypothetical protein
LLDCGLPPSTTNSLHFIQCNVDAQSPLDQVWPCPLGTSLDMPMPKRNKEKSVSCIVWCCSVNCGD